MEDKGKIIMEDHKNIPLPNSVVIQFSKAAAPMPSKPQQLVIQTP